MIKETGFITRIDYSIIQFSLSTHMYPHHSYKLSYKRSYNVIKFYYWGPSETEADLTSFSVCLSHPYIRKPYTPRVMIGHEFVASCILIGLLACVWTVSQSEWWGRDVSNAGGEKKNKQDASLYLSHACASHGARCCAAKRGDVLTKYYLT